MKPICGLSRCQIVHDKAVQYSVYFDLYLYACPELYMLDPTWSAFSEHLRPGIRRDYRSYRHSTGNMRTPFEPIVGRLYGIILRPSPATGDKTYNEVIAWLIALRKKNGWETV